MKRKLALTHEGLSHLRCLVGLVRLVCVYVEIAISRSKIDWRSWTYRFEL